MKLNIGSGMMQVAGWESYDIDPSLHPDHIGDCEALPFEDDSIEEIYASHVLEHVPYDSPALSEWYRVLIPGGVCTVIVPDIIQVFYLWRHGQSWGPYKLPITEDFMNATVFGGHILKDVPELHLGELGHQHRQIFIFDMLTQQMLKAGFCEVSDVAICSLRQSSFGETMVQGTKPILEAPPYESCFSDQPYCVKRRPAKAKE